MKTLAQLFPEAARLNSAELHWCRSWRSYDAPEIPRRLWWRDLSENGAEYGRWDSAEDKLSEPRGYHCSPEVVPLLVSDLFTFSDYSGGSVERANVRAWRERFSDSASRLWWCEMWGGHGTEALGFHPGLWRAARLGSDAARAMVEALESLDDYPLLDDEALSEIEMEAQSEAWESWAGGDYRRALASELDATLSALLGDEAAELLGSEVDLSEAPDTALFSLFLACSDSAGIYWEIETGGGASLDVERLAQETVRLAPLHVGALWASCERLSEDTRAKLGALLRSAGEHLALYLLIVDSPASWAIPHVRRLYRLGALLAGQLNGPDIADPAKVEWCELWGRSY